MLIWPAFTYVGHRRLLKTLTWGKKTAHQTNEIQEKRNTLHRRIEKWRQVQSIYMPSVSDLRAAMPAAFASSITHPEQSLLYLPSQIPQEESLFGDLVQKERRLRVAQADDALIELRRLLRITMGLWQYKHTQLGSGQHSNTRARALISRFKNKINRCADRYRAARNALKSLDPTAGWTMRFLELQPDDIRGPEKSDEDESERQRELSWIWLVQHDENVEDPRADATEEEINTGEVSKFFL